MKRWLLLFLIIGMAIGVLWSGCAGGKAKRGGLKTGLIYASSNKSPSWITDIPEEKEYYYFVGTARDSESFDSGKKEALSDALSQVVGVVGVKVTSSSTIEERYFAEQYTTTISSELFTEGKAKLQDAEVKEVYYEQHRRPDGSVFYRVWLLLKYSKSEIKREQERLKEILELKYGEVKRFEEEGSKFLESRMLFDAVVAHLNAASSALKIDEGEVFFDRNMNRASEILARMRVRKHGEDQVGYIGRALPDPLKLQVYYLEGDEEIPIPNVPVRFSYRVPREKSAGYKYEVANRLTDNLGLAEFRVDMIYEVSDSNKVEARIDLGPYIEQLRSVPDELRDRVKTLQEILGIKRTAFLFSSDTKAREIRTAVFFIQIDENDEILPKPVTTPAVYEILYAKKFSIKVLDINPVSFSGKSDGEILRGLAESAGKGVKRVLFGYVKILEYDMLSGFHTARASATATLYEKETDEILRTWEITRSATGNSKELAGINVLSETGKSLGEIISNTIP
jgi:hypothetical protein